MARFTTSSVTAAIRAGFLALASVSAAPTAGQPVEPGLRDAGLSGAGQDLVPAVWIAPNPARMAALPGWRVEAFASDGFRLEELRLWAVAAGGPVGRTALGGEVRQFGFAHYREVDVRIGLARRARVGPPAGFGAALGVGLTRITGLRTARAIGGSLGAWLRPHRTILLGGHLRRAADRYGARGRISGAVGLGIRLQGGSRLYLGSRPLASRSPRLAAGLTWRPDPVLAVSAGWRSDPSALSIGATIYVNTGTVAEEGTVFGGAVGRTHPVLGWTPAVGLGWIGPTVRSTSTIPTLARHPPVSPTAPSPGPRSGSGASNLR